MADERVSAEPKPEVAAPAPVAAPVAPTTSFGGGGGAGASVAAALRSGKMSPSGVLALQRMAGNQAIAGVLARQPAAAPAAPAAAAGPRTANSTPAINIEIPESVFEKLKVEGRASYFKGSAQVKGEVQFVAVETGTEASNNTAGASTAAQGVKVEREMQAGKWVTDMLGSLGYDKVEEGLTFEAGLKKLEVSASLQAKANSKYPWLKGFAELKGVAIGVEWDKINQATALGLELSGGYTGEGKVTLDGIDYIAKPKITLTGKVEPDWPKIAARAAQEGIKQGAKEGTRAAVQAVGTEAGATVIAVDGAAVGSAVAAIAIPVAAAVVMGYGAFQAMKNAQSAQEAAGQGAVLRDKANLWAKNYAKTLTGARGEGPGADEAEAQIAAIMAQTNAPREFVLAKVREERGGYLKLRDEALELIKPRLRAEAIKAFEESHKDDFGMLESLGEDFGMRGTFRKLLDQVLMHDTAPGGG